MQPNIKRLCRRCVSTGMWASFFVLGAATPPLMAQGLSPQTPSQEFIRLNGQVVAVENAVVPAAVTGATGWDTGNIGTGETAGQTTFSGSTYTVKGSGTGLTIGGASDQMQFGYTSLTGDGSLSARIASVTNAGAASQVGLIVRGSLDPGAPEAFLGLEGTGTTGCLSRLSAGIPVGNAGTVSGSAPEWIMIQRWGVTLFVFTSTDGLSWGSPTGEMRIPMGPSAYFGLMVSSGSATAVTTATFDNVTINRYPPFFSMSSGAGGTDDYFLLVNRKSGKVIDNVSGDVNDGQALQQWGLNNWTYQQWGILLNPNGLFTLSNRDNNYGLSLTTTSGTPSKTVNAPIVQSPQQYRTDQFWVMKSTDSTYVTLLNHYSGLALGVASGSVLDYAALEQVTYNATDQSQQWQLVPTGWSGIYGIFANGTQLSIPSMVTTAGAVPTATVAFNMPADQYEYGDYGLGAYQTYSDFAVAFAGTQSICTPAQYSETGCSISGYADGTVLTLKEANWGLTVANTTLHVFQGPFAGTVYKIESKNAIANGDSLYLRWNGTAVDEGPDDGKADVQWTFVSVSGGLYNLVNQSKKLGVTGASAANGATLTVSAASDASQTWQVYPMDATHFELSNQNASTAQGQSVAIYVPGSSTTAGTVMAMWDYDGADNKQWVLVPVS